jgi:DNA polymerase-3 subunit epsilon
VFKNLILSRPMAIIDLETTGADVQKDRIVEVAAVKVFPDGRREARSQRVNPGIPIPEAATAVHRISDAHVADKPGFDLRVLIAEFDRVDQPFAFNDRKIVDPLEIFHNRERRDLTAALRFYCGRDHDGAHGASADVRATLDILDAMLDLYADLPRSVDELHDAFRDERAADLDGKLIRVDGRVTFNFGKYRGRTLKDVAQESPDYIRWMLGQSFLEDTKQILRESLASGLEPGRRMA